MKNKDNELISISLTRDQWEQIASACISITDFNIVNDEIREALRKTYFEIKSEIR